MEAKCTGFGTDNGLKAKCVGITCVCRRVMYTSRMYIRRYVHTVDTAEYSCARDDSWDDWPASHGGYMMYTT